MRLLRRGFFVPPVAAIGGGAAAATPDANTTFLCRFNTATPVDEVSSSTGTLVGNATCDTANSRVALDGTGDWVTFPDLPVFDLGDPFTVEVHTTQAQAQSGGIMGRGSSGTGRWLIYCPGDGSAQFYIGNGVMVSSGFGVFDGTEHHIAIARSGTSWWFYKDGVQSGSTGNFATTVAGDTALFFIGTDPFDTTGRDIAANIGRVKISNTCRYPNGTTFTPPLRTAV